MENGMHRGKAKMFTSANIAADAKMPAAAKMAAAANMPAAANMAATSPALAMSVAPPTAGAPAALAPAASKSAAPAPPAAPAPIAPARVAPPPAAAPPLLEVRSLGCGYGDRRVVSNVSFSLEGGQALCLLGPNGVGKTTLFKTLLGFLPAQEGAILIEGSDASALSRRALARTVAYIPQEHTVAFSFTVHEFVLMGRTPALGTFQAPDAHDDRVATEALAQLGIEHLAQRDYTSLSGGERQMVLVARALAQHPRLLVMDEPCSSLDLGNQMRLIAQVKALVAQGMAVIMTTHEPNHAFEMGGRVLCLGRDGHMRMGAVDEVLTSEELRVLYGVGVQVVSVEAASGRVARGCVPLLDE